MNKLHLGVGAGYTTNACKRKGRAASCTSSVTCLSCQKTDEFAAALKTEKELAEVSFYAQSPVRVAEPWSRGTTMACSDCGHEFFRYKGRSGMGHYEDYVCARCEHVESRMTETGMSF